MRFISVFGNCFKKRLRGGDESDGGGGNTWELLIGLRILEAATYGFSKVNRLGPGGFGPVYKGLMPDGQEVTIKKLSVNSKQGVPEFVNEVKLLLKIQHRNLVTLLGCCAEGPEKMLVYEYLPNKSLDNFLLVWLGFFLGVDTHLNTLRISGTRGYMVPGYAMHGYLSVKTDVFSFGVLVLEIVSGRKNYELVSEEKADLLIYTWMLFREGKAMKIIDLNLKTYNHDEVAMCIQLGLLWLSINCL